MSDAQIFRFDRLKRSMCVLALTVFPTPVVQAQTYKWIENVQIVHLEPAAGGWVWVRLNIGTVNCADVGGPSSNGHLMLTTGNSITFADGAFDRIYSTMLTSLAASKTVTLRITGSNTSEYCIIERIVVKSN